jgi:hypothetical protein
MKLRAPLVLAMTAAVLVLTAGVSWASAHGGVSATVAQDGTAVFTTTNGPATTDIAVTVASYTGLWKNQTEPEKLFKVVHGVIAAGTSSVTLKVEVPACGPYQVDTFLGNDVPDLIYYPTGSGENGLKGREYPNGTPCTTSPSPSSSPSPSTSPSVSPTTSTSHHPSTSPSSSPTTSVLGTKQSASPELAATGSSGYAMATALGGGLVLLGLVLVATARRARRH